MMSIQNLHMTSQVTAPPHPSKRAFLCGGGSGADGGGWGGGGGVANNNNNNKNGEKFRRPVLVTIEITRTSEVKIY